MNRFETRRAIALALLAGCVAGARAQGTGAGQIRLVVGQAPGGALDVLGRLVAAEGAKLLGVQILIDNKPGSGGIVAATEVARAPADGRTFLLTTLSPLVNNPVVYAKLPYDGAKSFAPVATVGRFPLVLYVRADGPYKTVEDLIAAARARPGALNFGNMGAANLSNLAAERLAEVQSFRFTPVPFNGEPPMMVALASGQIDAVITTVGGGLSLVQGGRLRVLGMLDSERFAALPGVPTMAEQGFKGIEASGISCIVAPAGTPREAIARLNDAINQALQQPEVKKRMQQLLMVPMGGSSQDLVNLMRSEGERWIPIIKRLGIRED